MAKGKGKGKGKGKAKAEKEEEEEEEEKTTGGETIFPELTEPGWRAVLEREAKKPYFRDLVKYAACDSTCILAHRHTD